MAAAVIFSQLYIHPATLCSGKLGPGGVQTSFLKRRELAPCWPLPRGHQRHWMAPVCQLFLLVSPSKSPFTPGLQSVGTSFLSLLKPLIPSSTRLSSKFSVSCVPSPRVAAASCVDLWLSSTPPFHSFRPLHLGHQSPYSPPSLECLLWPVFLDEPQLMQSFQEKSQDRDPQRRVLTQHGCALVLDLVCARVFGKQRAVHGDLGVQGVACLGDLGSRAFSALTAACDDLVRLLVQSFIVCKLCGCQAKGISPVPSTRLGTQ